MAQSHDNYLQLEQPEEWACQLWSIDSDYSMKIRLYKPYQTGSQWAIFQDVIYFEGPTSWTGAQVQLNVSENILIPSLSVNNSLSQQLSDDVPRKYKLFTVQANEQLMVRFVAKEGHLETSLKS